MNSRILLSIFVALTLTACVTDNEFKPKVTVGFEVRTNYPELPNMDIPPDVNLIPWRHDLPRDTTREMIVKKLTRCLKVPKEERTKSNTQFWAECGEYPIITDTQLHIGFTQENWSIILEDFTRLKLRNYQLRQRLLEVNRQRENWRKKADEQRAKDKTRDESSIPTTEEQVKVETNVEQVNTE